MLVRIADKRHGASLRNRGCFDSNTSLRYLAYEGHRVYSVTEPLD